MFRRISTHFTTTPGIPSPSTAPQPARPEPITGLSPALTGPTEPAAYAPFTPSESGQRSHPPYYRGCWHGVSRCLFRGYRPSSSPRKGVYNPRAVLPHAASLRQALAHCARSLTAATRRCLGRVPVPVWPTILSDRPPVTGLVRRYRTNHLMGRAPLHRRPEGLSSDPPTGRSACGITPRFRGLFPTAGQVRHVLLSRPPLDPKAPLDLHV